MPAARSRPAAGPRPSPDLGGDRALQSPAGSAAEPGVPAGRSLLFLLLRTISPPRRACLTCETATSEERGRAEKALRLPGRARRARGPPLAEGRPAAPPHAHAPPPTHTHTHTHTRARGRGEPRRRRPRMRDERSRPASSRAHAPVQPWGARPLLSHRRSPGIAGKREAQPPPEGSTGPRPRLLPPASTPHGAPGQPRRLRPFQC